MFPTDPLVKHFRLSPLQEKALARLGIQTVRDLLFYFPSRYEEPGAVKPIHDIAEGERVTLSGTIARSKTAKAFRKKIPLAEATLEDATGSIRIVWFRQAYMAKQAPEGTSIRVSGIVSRDKHGKFYLANPVILPAANTLILEGGTDFLLPVYPETRGLSSRWFAQKIARVLSSGVHKNIEDPLPLETCKKYSLPSLQTGLVWIHTPRSQNDAAAARKRFSFEEVFSIQLARLIARQYTREHGAHQIHPNHEAMHRFAKVFPYRLTPAQARAWEAISFDLSNPHPMLRLLEGDVGSGKTAVAAHAAFATVHARSGKAEERFQVGYMAPTEILAEQQFKSFCEYFKNMPIEIGLLTGSGAKKFPSKVDPRGATDISRAQLLKWLREGRIAMLIGTHALIQKSVEFKQLALVIVDEQHRFGVRQRAELIQKNAVAPHLLSMTATPIPRTLALTVYGDLDLTLIDEMPAGRKPVITEAVPHADRTRVYRFIEGELAAGRQAYVICPRINEPDPSKELALQVRSAKEEVKRLQKLFPNRQVGLLHGKIKAGEKDTVMHKFLAHDIDILVATSVVEVGVNIPNATVIIIEGAERFGLAQLHQLRGRVARSTYQAYCFLFVSENASLDNARVQALTRAKNGFELAELDLKLRGAGTLSGGKQWGISDIGMDALQNLKMVEAARTEAQMIIEKDPSLSTYPVLRERLQTEKKDVHWE